jgi:DNA-directed RNA polymerase subunit alpha
MHIIHDEIGLPKITSRRLGGHSFLLTVSPLPNGFGVTLGNALRRVLLSSVPGAAVTAVRVDGVSHEYTTISGMRESVLDLCLNLKQIALKKYSPGVEISSLSKKGEGSVCAKDISFSSDIELLNPDLVLSTLGEKEDGLRFEVKIDKGVGYISAREQQKDSEDGENWIYLDANFSPVLKVKYEVFATRVGENTNLDKLELEVETNGSIDPDDAVKFSAGVLKSYFDLFQKEEEEKVEPGFMATLDSVAASTEGEEEDAPQESYTPVEVLGLSPRTLNALLNGEIGSVEALVKCTPARLGNFRGFGKKAMEEVDKVLQARNLSLAEEE